MKNIDIKISGLKILSKIGDGGMSVVYLAEQISLKRKVAVKVMRLEIAENELDVQRFKHEAKTIAHLDHPNIINIYNIGQTEKGEIFFTMPFLNHGDFSSYILENEEEFITLLKTICDGLSFAHDRGVVHRDIKPENLLFDKFGNVRIADFGIAISKDGTRMTKEHQIVGSAQYMSPEQARSLKVDIHSDIYSLGIVIYERLTGKVPFDSDESISILVNHVSMEPEKLPVKMRHWQKLIDKCLAKAPRDRFQSMVELKIALEKIPVNSLQRTNSSIQHVLTSDQGQHLKWFIPSLILLFVIAYFIYQPTKNVAPNEQLIIQNNPITNPLENKPIVSNVINNGTNTNSTPTITIENSNEYTATITNDDTLLTPINNTEVDIENATIETIKDSSADTKENIADNKAITQANTPPINTNDSATADPDVIKITPLQDFATANDKSSGNLDQPDQDLSIEQIKKNLKRQQFGQATPEIQIIQTTTDIDAKEQPLSQEAIKQLLDKAAVNIKIYQLSKPKSDNATDQLLQVLSSDPDNTEAQVGLITVGKKYFQLIDSAMNKYDFEKALNHVKSVKSFNQITNNINTKFDIQKASIISIARNLDLSSANITVEQVKILALLVQELSPNHVQIEKLEKLALLKSGPQVGDKLLDKQGIETILLTKKLAITTKEITLKDYKIFANETNRASSKCKHKGGGVGSLFSSKTWIKPHFTQKPNHPVVCVSHEDASAYGKWLSKKTQNRYRLPTQGEWLALAAIEMNTFEACKSANVAGSEASKIRNKEDNYSCSDNYKFTAPAASFSMNNLGIFDIQGNVSEWVNCKQSPCQEPTAMGSSWFHGKQSNKLNIQDKLKLNASYSHVGFRLIRDI